MHGEDTIVAVSTAVGLGAIGIVRLSGPDAVAIAGNGFQPARGQALQPEDNYRLLYGHVVDPVGGGVVDEALLAVMRRPHSYTREDVIELHCHGGLVAQRAVLRLMVRLGARPAEPGEFTRRALLNGRIDLAQAESVAAIVSARSTGALRASVRQLDGGLSNRLRGLRRELVGLLAGVEATVDFSDEDIDEVDGLSLARGLADVQAGLVSLLGTAFVGRALEHGVRTAIVGKPNVGKSSLLNALLMRERAIVSEEPGTTRDTVEEMLEIAGIPFHLVDTAGIRSDGGELERLGIERSRRAMEQADLVLAVVDLSDASGEVDSGLLRQLDRGRSIIVGNKLDLVGDPGKALKRVTSVASAESDEEWRACAVSALTGEGLEELRALVEDVITGGAGLDLDEPILAGERQRALVAEAVESTAGALAAVQVGRDEELVCEDIRSAIEALGRMTGENLTADLLDEIFNQFCIGK